MIYLGTDHRGFALKEKIKTWLTEWGMEFIDCGNLALDPVDDYPDFVAQVAAKVSEDPINNLGIVLGATGQGEAMVANHRHMVRTAVIYQYNEEVIKLTREHNASNILALGASFISDDDAQKTIKLWLDTPFSKEERHIRRIAKIDA